MKLHCINCQKKARFEMMLALDKKNYEIKDGFVNICFCDECFLGRKISVSFKDRVKLALKVLKGGKNGIKISR